MNVNVMSEFQNLLPITGTTSGATARVSVGGHAAVHRSSRRFHLESVITRGRVVKAQPRQTEVGVEGSGPVRQLPQVKEIAFIIRPS